MNIKKIDHINISVSDLEKSKAFFTDLFGFKILNEGMLEGEWIDKLVDLKNVRAKYVQMQIPGTQTNLELIYYESPKAEKEKLGAKASTIGFRHMAFQVENIEEVYDRLKKAGVKIFSELQIYNKTKKLCYFYGPDNIILEIAQYD